MGSQELTSILRNNGFTRVEKDDRLLDVFPKETSEKGVELWEKWEAETVELIRLHNGTKNHHSFPRVQIEQALQENTQLKLQ